MSAREPDRSPVRGFVEAILWSAFQAGSYLVIFEIGRRTTFLSKFWTADVGRALFWQYSFFLFSALSVAGNLWIATRAVGGESSRRVGVWTSVLLILVFFCRTHFGPRTAASVLVFVCAVGAIALREGLSTALRRRSG